MDGCQLWNTGIAIDQISKNNVNNRSQFSHCWINELQVREENKLKWTCSVGLALEIIGLNIQISVYSYRYSYKENRIEYIYVHTH